MDVPDVRVFGRTETVEVHRIGFKALLAQCRAGIAYAQGQQYPAFFKHQPVKAGQQAPQLFVQFLGQRHQFGMSGSAAQDIGGAGRVRFARHHMQDAWPLRVGFPGLPGDQKIQPQPEACFQDAPLRLIGPCCRQAAAVQKDFTRLRQPT